MNTNTAKEFDIIVVGGGISGLALAYGLCRHDATLKIALFDAPTPMNKASRTNVGLVWCQSKFLHAPDYARWAFLSAQLFPELLRDLHQCSGIKVPVNFTGGLIPVLGETEYTQRETYIRGLKDALGNYPGAMLDRSALENKLPKIAFGAEVTGAAWCEADGVLEPLLLMRAFKESARRLGVTLYDKSLVYDVVPPKKTHNAYAVNTAQGTFYGQRLVFAAGLANRRLAHFALQDTGKSLPIFADKGEVLLTERLPYVMPIPVLGCTQTFGGTVIIGFKHETRGHDATVNLRAVAQEGAWAVRVWPELATKRIIRSWSGLRIMPDDGVAIYSHLPLRHDPQGRVTVINTHSAVTLSAVHSRYLPEFILGGALPRMAENMTLQRFGFDCTAKP